MQKKMYLLLLVISIVFLFYFFSLNREWQFFDERLIFKEELFPIPVNFSELFEVIRTFAFNYHVDSQNAFFSNIITVRSNTIGAILNILISFVFGKTALFYHILQITLHLINTILIWFIFFNLFASNKLSQKENHVISSLLTLIWALHPVNVEAVLLTTNWTSLLTYGFCFAFILNLLVKINNDCIGRNLGEFCLLVILFLISIFISEYSYTLPFILLFFGLYLLLKKNKPTKESIITSLRLSLPFFIGLLIYGIYFLSKSVTLFQGSFNLTLQRVFWLSPQIFVHFLKLFLYPKDLSLYQTNLITLADTLFHPYAVFSFSLLSIFIFLPACMFSKSKHDNASGYLLSYPFLFSIFPFLQIFSPTYCLMAERYCYFPLFIFLLFLAALTIEFFPMVFSKKSFHAILIIVLIVFSTCSAIRISDWQNSFTLYSSALKCHSNHLYKGQIYSVLGYYLNAIGKTEQLTKYLNLSIDELNKAINELRLKSSSPPKILINYGLDAKSLITTCAFSIASTRLNYFKETPEVILKFYEPYISNNLSNTGNSQIDFYAKLLIETGQTNKAIEVLQKAREKYPLSPILMYRLSNLYLQTKDLNNAEKIVQELLKYFISYKRTLPRAIKLSELQNDQPSLAKYEYLLGLRIYSLEAYQKSAQIYLSFKKLNEAKKILDKLLALDKNNSLTYLLLSKYYNLNAENSKVLVTLNKAYEASKNSTIQHQEQVHKSILLSLISFNLSYGKPEEAKRYIIEFEQIPNLKTSERELIKKVKKKFKLE